MKDAAAERTLSIVKPDAVSDGNMGRIITRFEQEGVGIVAAKLAWLAQEKAEGFYIEHKGKPFFGELVQFMISGPVMIMVLEGEDAVRRNREIMGATNPAEAAQGTLRNLYAKSIGENAVHGSDSPESAKREIDYFFEPREIIRRPAASA